MSRPRDDLAVGWQSRPLAIALVCAAGTLSALATAAAIGGVAGFLVLCTCALAGMVRMQWCVLDGATLRLRDAGSGYVDRVITARRFVALRYRRSLVPWCRFRTERVPGGLRLVLSAPSPRVVSLRSVTLWMIVHGRRRARIDARLLDALAAMPEHGPAKQPHDASHA